MNQSKRILKNNWTKKYNVKEVFLNTSLQSQTINYLKNQSYIDYKGINKILRINYNKYYPTGYVVETKNKIVGFVGTLFSKRKINNKNYLYCNIHTWIVDQSHRVASHLLFVPLLKKKCIITVLSAQNRLIKTFKKMGFKTIQMNYKIIFSNIFFSFFYKNSFQIEKKFSKIKLKLTNHNLKICKDHYNTSFIKFIILNKRNKSDFTLVIAKIVRKKKYFNVLNILYASNIHFLQKNWDSINIEIFKVYKVFFCGQYFIKKKECIFSKKSNLSINFKRTICVKNFPKNFIFNTIYSEAI